MGKVIISGSGKGSSAIGFWWFFNIVQAIIGVAFFVWLAYEARGLSFSRTAFGLVPNASIGFTQRSYIFFGAGVVLFVLVLICAAIEHRNIARTEIRVFDDCIMGTAVSKWFLFGDFKMRKFQIPFSQVTSMEVSKVALTIKTAGSEYKCYVNNGEKIQSVVRQLSR